MVVNENDGCGISRQGSLDDLPRMHTGAIDGAAEQFLEGDQPVPGIQVQAAPTILVVNFTIIKILRMIYRESKL
jgi:hypothetical protein